MRRTASERVHIVADDEAMLPAVGLCPQPTQQTPGRSGLSGGNRNELPASWRRTKSTHALQIAIPIEDDDRSEHESLSRMIPVTKTRRCDARAGPASPESYLGHRLGTDGAALSYLAVRP
jgi:hypothetical protein